jgi:hypothetical protein
MDPQICSQTSRLGHLGSLPEEQQWAALFIQMALHQNFSLPHSSTEPSGGKLSCTSQHTSPHIGDVTKVERSLREQKSTKEE